MNLIDSVAQCHLPFVVQDRTSGKVTALNNTADCAASVARCPLRYVLTDDLTRLCADLAYSKGARTVDCADLLHVPAAALWVEWCNEPWMNALQQYGFPLVPAAAQWVGRRGAWVRSSRDGRRGLMRTFWSVAGADVLDSASSQDDILGRCFRFRYEQSWSEYYGSAGLSSELGFALWRHAVGTIATDIPMLLSFFLLLATRSGLPQRAQTFEHLNRRRRHRGKAPLLEHIEVCAPLLPEYRDGPRGEPRGTRTSPRLHHVRGHLVRRGSQIFWRVPHLRGSARAGAVRTRTVTWSFDRAAAGRVH